MWQQLKTIIHRHRQFKVWNKTGDVYEDFSNDEDMFDFSNYLIKSKHCNDSNKLVVGKMKEKTVGVTIEEFVGLKPKMYSHLVDDNTKRKKQRWE